MFQTIFSQLLHDAYLHVYVAYFVLCFITVFDDILLDIL